MTGLISSERPESVPEAPMTGATQDHPSVEYTLAAIRRASARMRLATTDLEAVGIALRDGIVTVRQALDWVEELGAMPLLEELPGIRVADQ